MDILILFHNSMPKESISHFLNYGADSSVGVFSLIFFEKLVQFFGVSSAGGGADFQKQHNFLGFILNLKILFLNLSFMGLQISFQLCHKKNEYIKYLFMSQGRLSPGKGRNPG